MFANTGELRRMYAGGPGSIRNELKQAPFQWLAKAHPPDANIGTKPDSEFNVPNLRVRFGVSAFNCRRSRRRRRDGNIGASRARANSRLGGPCGRMI
jgi:hypothetical protein